MTHIITENCVKCKFTDCVNVCPVDCFFEGKNFLVIDPRICIDCAICIYECPINAIKYYDFLNKKDNLFYKINYELSKIWPNINKNKITNKNKHNWALVKNKLHLIKL